MDTLGEGTVMDMLGEGTVMDMRVTGILRVGEGQGHAAGSWDDDDRKLSFGVGRVRHW